MKILNELLAYPNLHYRTLCTRAAILRLRARWAAPEERDAITTEAIGHLKQAIALTETPARDGRGRRPCAGGVFCTLCGRF